MTDAEKLELIREWADSMSTDAGILNEMGADEFDYGFNAAADFVLSEFFGDD